MKAAIIEEFGGQDVVKIADIPKPTPNDNEVQIHIEYASVNPADWKIREGLFRDRMPYEFPITLGWDVAGKISQVGKNVKGFKIGDAVFAYAKGQKIHAGTFAEFICIEADKVVAVPKNLSMRDAAAIPLVTLTAWQAVVEIAKLQPNEVILVHAGAGSVGSMAIQIARNIGAKIITTASPKNYEYVKSLGAGLAIDYRQEDFIVKTKKLFPQGIDVVFDCVGSPVTESSLQVLKPGGRLVSILQRVDEAKAKQFGVKADYVFVRADGAHLKQIAKWIEEDKLVPPRIQEFPFSKVSDVIEMVKHRQIEGKAVLSL